MTSHAVSPTSASTSTNGLAIASLVTSLLGISLVGVILGHVSRKQIRETGQGGWGLSTAGLVLGYLGLVGGLMFVAITVMAAASGA
jgi:hypothetical protein